MNFPGKHLLQQVSNSLNPHKPHGKEAELIGKIASVTAEIGPKGGLIEIDGKTLPARGTGTIIEAGSQVRILSIHEKCLVVRRENAEKE